MKETKEISNPLDYNKLLKPNEVQMILGVGKNKMYTMLKNGTIPGIRLGNSWRVSPRDLAETLSQASSHADSD